MSVPKNFVHDDNSLFTPMIIIFEFYSVNKNLSEITDNVFNITQYGVKKKHPYIESIFT